LKAAGELAGYLVAEELLGPEDGEEAASEEFGNAIEGVGP
jgi:hypothetical protein